MNANKPEFNLIAAIQEVRRRTGCGLKEAKDAVEAHRDIESAVRELKPTGSAELSTFREMTNDRWAALFYTTSNRDEHLKLVGELTAAVLREAADRVREKRISGAEKFSGIILDMIK